MAATETTGKLARNQIHIDDLREARKMIRFTNPHSRDAFVVAACMLGWIGLTGLIRNVFSSDNFYGIPLALCAVILASWISGLLAGLVVTALSVLFLSVALPAEVVVGAQTESFWHLLVFSMTALLASGIQSTARALNDRLRDEVEFKNSFVVLMAHELRTPATLIHSGIRVLQRHRTDLSSEEAGEVVDNIEAESARFATLVDDILTLARVEAGLNGSAAPLSLTQVVREEVRAFRQSHTERPVECDIPDEDCSVLGQSRYIDVVMRHLLSNADMYSPLGTSIMVRVIDGGADVSVSVRDYGPGLNKDELESVFEPYYRGRLVPVGMRGLGLGLALSRRLVEAMRGHIFATAAAGGGLEVSFTLPRT
ncbi:MAG TPA: HAMP domain-containing sensor histidine kinase [Dehalococcoidia bacterium]